MNGGDAAAFREIAVGAGVFFILLAFGISALMLSRRLADVLTRVERTIADVDQQIGTLSVPVVDALSHVNGIAATADSTVAKLGNIVGTIENITGAVGKTTSLAQNAVTPSLVNFGAALTGITAGLRRIVRGPSAGQGEGTP